MSLTFVQKSDVNVRKPNAKKALVLAGGAVSGGAYKLGGLKALNDYMVNFKMTDFDMHVGLSAGALLSAAIANGVAPEEMLKSLNGTSESFSQLKPWDFYWPNVRELAGRPLRFVGEVATFSPVATLVLMASKTEARNKLKDLGQEFLARPTYHSGEAFVSMLLALISEHVEIPNPARALMPSGFFDNSRLETYLRENIERVKGHNRFEPLHRQAGKELYISATNLDTAERAVFGWDELSEPLISQAVQASTAIPGFYQPVRIGGEDYIDGGVRKTANIDIAIEKGAELIIVYNPFRPLVSSEDPKTWGSRRTRRRLVDEGIGSIINQVFRTLLHTRLILGMDRYASDPNFRGDIILIEPEAGDEQFFEMNPLAFWRRGEAAKHGFESVITSVQGQFDRMRSILRSYGIEMSQHYVRSELQKLKLTHANQSEVFDILEERSPLHGLRLATGG